jgi:hypothetical protein
MALNLLLVLVVAVLSAAIQMWSTVLRAFLVALAEKTALHLQLLLVCLVFLRLLLMPMSKVPSLLMLAAVKVVAFHLHRILTGTQLCCALLLLLLSGYIPLGRLTQQAVEMAAAL